jgi:Raf kinase inhibitor-like YbhB/YbcL family protein
MFLKIEAFSCGSCGSGIPTKYTCDGSEISPGMQWSDVPENVKSFAVLMEGLDTPNRSNPLVLWLLYDIPRDIREIKTNSLPAGTKVGKNDRGRLGYSGPCPNPGTDHQRYLIRLYALGEPLMLSEGLTKDEFVRLAKEHIIDQTEVVATYERFDK